MLWYTNTLDEAIAKIREQREGNGENWTGEEWIDDMYGGVLLLVNNGRNNDFYGE